MDTKALVDQLSPILLQALGVIGTALLAWIGTAVSKRANAVKGEVDMNALHSALTTGATAAAATMPNAPVREIVSEAIDYAQKSVPDALKALNPSGAVLATLAHAKAAEAMSGQQQIAVSKPL
jgi:hypothetical protein